MKFTPQQIREYGEKVIATLDDGFQWSDIVLITPMVMEITGQVDEMTNEEKHETAEMLIDYVLENTDFWGPDSVIDPVAASVLKALIPVLAKVHKGEFKI